MRIENLLDELEHMEGKVSQNESMRSNIDQRYSELLEKYMVSK